ncbi:metallophosphoesterase family protein [Maribacter algicola]|uniref:metallophosphoesterase family protein n=1 Tax=Maribacter algicola TaxID=2498892 RepID=UPI001402F3CA|nr:metallophosphoesterase [Maribacter algicola]
MNFFKNNIGSILFVLGALGSSCTINRELINKETQIAVIADAHLQNVYGELEDNEYSGVANPKNGKYTFIRTMQSQLQSTRIFNENYFAFLAALDDIVARNIKYVLLPGDFSDDGQPLHIRGFKKILDKYTQEYGLTFLLITGNHDVVYPYDHEDGKRDFLGQGGKPQTIASTAGFMENGAPGELPIVISKDLQNLGYGKITRLLKDHGFFPKKEYHYWATPFSKYSYEDYTFNAAKAEATLEQRSYRIPHNSTALPDVSYVVEPVEGIWLLALDANTYLQKEMPNTDSVDQIEYKNNGQGLDNLLTHKKYLVEWIEKLTISAKKYNKTLIAFSHYPMSDFNNGATQHINNLLVGSKMQIKRIPNPKLATTLADAGLRLHLGGHMHLNDTGISTSKKGNILVNIQTPSLAAYMPAYKILTMVNPDKIQVKTVVIDSVPRYNEFFDLYKKEYQRLMTTGDSTIWNKDVLESTSYKDLMNWHLKELVRLRFLPSEWHSDFAKFIMDLSGKELLFLSQSKSQNALDEQLNNLRDGKLSFESLYLDESISHKIGPEVLELYNAWSGGDLIFDLYRLRSADQLAFKDIGEARLKQYDFLIQSFLSNNSGQKNNDLLKKRILDLMRVLQNFMTGEPSVDFELHMKTGKIKPLNEKGIPLH